MKSTGIVRKVDELGRIVLPVELRRALGIEDQDEMEIYLDNGNIVLQKFAPSCTFCASTRDLVTFHGKNICRECIQRISGH